MTSEPLDNPDITGDSGEDAESGLFGVAWLTRDRVSRLFKFGVVGASGVGVNLVVFELVYRFVLTAIPTQTRVTLANGAGLIVSIFTNFLLNDYWTWGDRLKGTLRHWFGRVAKYYVSASVAGVVQLVVTWATFRYAFQYLALTVDSPEFVQGWLGGSGDSTVDLSPTIAVLTGIACGMIINFLASHLWAFQDAEVES